MASRLTPQPGDVLLVTRRASVQFVKPITLRVIRVHDWPTYHGWMWLDGYQLNRAGDAVQRRSIFVMSDGLQLVAARADCSVPRGGAAVVRGRSPRVFPRGPGENTRGKQSHRGVVDLGGGAHAGLRGAFDGAV